MSTEREITKAKHALQSALDDNKTQAYIYYLVK
jgi:hypothetical protein